MANIQEDLQDKVKIRVIGTPMNMQGELVLDFRNTGSLSISLYPKFKTIESAGDITIQEGDMVVKKGDLLLEDITSVIKIDDIQIIKSQEPAIVGLNAVGTAQDGTARNKINEIIVMLRNHGLIAP